MRIPQTTIKVSNRVKEKIREQARIRTEIMGRNVTENQVIEMFIDLYERQLKEEDEAP